MSIYVITYICIGKKSSQPPVDVQITGESNWRNKIFILHHPPASSLIKNSLSSSHFLDF